MFNKNQTTFRFEHATHLMKRSENIRYAAQRPCNNDAVHRFSSNGELLCRLVQQLNWKLQAVDLFPCHLQEFR